MATNSLEVSWSRWVQVLLSGDSLTSQQSRKEGHSESPQGSEQRLPRRGVAVPLPLWRRGDR